MLSSPRGKTLDRRTRVTSTAPFHLAFTVRDIAETRAFFGGLFGCTEGFVSDTRVDFDFFGNHLVAHLRRDTAPVAGSIQTDEPRIRGKGAHEQAIMFLTDPSGNTFEFKGLKDPTPAQLLARR